MDVFFMSNLITSEIQDIISDISLHSQDGSVDKSLVFLLIASGLNIPGHQFTDARLEVAISVFERRWSKLIDTPNDYTIESDGINSYWIRLAHCFSDISNRTYLEFLFPSVKNKTDIYNSSRQLIDCNDLSNFFLLDDGTSLGCVDSLEEHWSKKGFVSVVKKNDEGAYVDEPLTLKELHRILAKNSLSELKPAVKFAKKLRQEIMRDWVRRGSIPQPILSLLVELLKSYFDQGERNGFSAVDSQYEGFKPLMMALTNELSSFDIADVYHFYARVLDTGIPGKKSSFLLCELLMKCAVGNLAKIKPKMEAVVEFLCNCAPSLIVDSKLLHPIYKRYGIGEGFSLALLKDCIVELKKNASLSLVAKLNELEVKINFSSVTLEEAILPLRAIYAMRWSEVKGKLLDYTRQQGCVNLWWIRTAQILSGAKLIESNYYRFLIPTLSYDEDINILDPLINHSLNHFILSEDETNLILLDNSVKHYKQTKLFYNCSVNPPVPFTAVEEVRLAFTHEKFHSYISLIRNEQLPLMKSSVLIFRDLVDATLDERGLDPSMSTDEDQVIMAGRGFMFFREALKQLPEDELNRVLDHRTYFRGTNFSVRELIAKIERAEEDGCIATCVKIFAQLVINHGDHFTFIEKIENSPLIAVSLMRTISAKKVFRDYDFLTADEAVRRNNILMISLLTHDFNHMLTGYDLSLWDHHNKGDDVILAIFSQLKSYIELTDYRLEARYTFTSILEGHVFSQLEKNTGMSKEVRDWLLSVKDSKLFTDMSQFNVTCYDPSQIFLGLSQFQEDNVFGDSVRRFLFEIVQALKDSSGDLMKTVHVNVAYYYFSQRFGKKEQNDFSKAIDANRTWTNDFFCDSVFYFLVLRASLSIRAYGSHFFSIPFLRSDESRKSLIERKPKEWLPCTTVSYIGSLVDEAQLMPHKELDTNTHVSRICSTTP